MKQSLIHQNLQQGSLNLFMTLITTKMFSFSFADDVSINDEVLVHGEDKVIAEKVVNISNLEMQGNCQFYTSIDIG